MSKRKVSPVWPPFPGCGYEGAYQPVLADQLIAAKQDAERRLRGTRTAADRRASGRARRPK